MHDGRKILYKFEKDGINHTLLQLQDEYMLEDNGPKALLMSGK